MAYVAVTTAEITTGEPTASTLLSKVKDNFSDHEVRLQDLEGGVTSSPPAIILRVNGYAMTSTTFTGIVKTAINFNLKITGVRLYIDQAGSSGTTQVDVLYKRAAGSFTSILTTKPSVAYTAGNDAVSTNAVINTSQDDLEAGDIIRLDIDSLQVGGINFFVRLDYERT